MAIEDARLSLQEECILSTNLGDHQRKMTGFGVQVTLPTMGRLSATLGACVYRYTDWGTTACPSVDLGFRLSESLRLYASAGKSFRVPTFTDLYYKRPATVGNPFLRPEAWAYEAGAKWRKGGWTLESGAYLRKGKDLIDFVRGGSSAVWRAENADRVDTVGAELLASWAPWDSQADGVITSFRLGYADCKSREQTPPFESRYVLDHFKQQVLLSFDAQWPSQVRQS